MWLLEAGSGGGRLLEASRQSSRERTSLAAQACSCAGGPAGAAWRDVVLVLGFIWWRQPGYRASGLVFLVCGGRWTASPGWAWGCPDAPVRRVSPSLGVSAAGRNAPGGGSCYSTRCPLWRGTGFCFPSRGALMWWQPLFHLQPLPQRCKEPEA